MIKEIAKNSLFFARVFALGLIICLDLIDHEILKSFCVERWRHTTHLHSVTERFEPEFALLLEIEPCKRVDNSDNVRSHWLVLFCLREIHAIRQ